MPTETTGPPRNMASEQDDYEDTSAMAVMLRNENAAREAAAVTQIAAEDDGDDWEDVGNERGQDTTDADGAGPQEAEVAVGGNEGDRRVPNAMVGAAAQNVPPLNMDHQYAPVVGNHGKLGPCPRPWRGGGTAHEITAICLVRTRHARPTSMT